MTRQHPQDCTPCDRVIGAPRRRPATAHNTTNSRLTQRAISPHEWTANSPRIFRSQCRIDGDSTSTSRLERPHVRSQLKPTSLGGYRRVSSLGRWGTITSLSAARNFSAAIAVLVLIIFPGQGADLTTEYLKPSVSSKASFVGKQG